MKQVTLNQIFSHLLLLLIGLGIGYLTWAKNISSSSNSNVITKVAPDDILTPKGGDLSLDVKKQVDSISAISTKKAPTDKEDDQDLATTSTDKLEGDSYLKRVNMGISDKKIGEILSTIAKNLEDKRLAYRSDLMQDCSGIFHQMKDSLQKRLPALAEGIEYQYPSSQNVRNTRQIADWFYKNNNLLIVQDAVVSKNSIRPGSVMFYGKSNKTFKNIDIDLLTDRANNYTSNGAIMHIAVVTAITTDAEGNVVDYTIMHGRNPRNHASRTGSKEVQSTRTPGLPPFGNWSQQLVAIANIATPKA